MRAEKEELSELASKRRQADADYERERARLEELRYRKALEERMAAMADQAAQAAANPYVDYYPGYPAYPIVGRPCGRHCIPPTVVQPDPNKKRKEPSVRLRMDP
jgi:hypothetical protein